MPESSAADHSEEAIYAALAEEGFGEARVVNMHKAQAEVDEFAASRQLDRLDSLEAAQTWADALLVEFDSLEEDDRMPFLLEWRAKAAAAVNLMVPISQYIRRSDPDPALNELTHSMLFGMNGALLTAIYHGEVAALEQEKPLLALALKVGRFRQATAIQAFYGYLLDARPEAIPTHPITGESIINHHRIHTPEELRRYSRKPQGR